MSQLSGFGGLIRIALMFLRPILRLINRADLDEPPVIAGAHPKRGLGIVAEKIATTGPTLGAKVITTKAAIHFVFVALHDPDPIHPVVLHPQPVTETAHYGMLPRANTRSGLPLFLPKQFDLFVLDLSYPHST